MDYNELYKVKRFAMEGKPPSKVELVRSALDNMSAIDLMFCHIFSGNACVSASPIEQLDDEISDRGLSPLEAAHQAHNGYTELDADVCFFVDDCLFCVTAETYCEMFVDKDALAWFAVVAENDCGNDTISELLDSKNPQFPVI